MQTTAGDLSWTRLRQVVLLCLILSTQVLFQPGIFELWSPGRVMRGWLDFFAEILLCGLGMWAALGAAGRLVVKQRWLRAGLSIAALATGSFIGYCVALLLLQPAGFYPPLPAML